MRILQLFYMVIYYPKVNYIIRNANYLFNSLVKTPLRIPPSGLLTLKTDSGEIKITLWNDDCENINEGDKVKVVNGYVREFQGEKQLSAGKFGKIEKI